MAGRRRPGGGRAGPGHAPELNRLVRAARLASAALCLAGTTLWCLPLLASGLLALLRYGFGSLFLVGESVAAALLRSGGADIAGTVGRLATDPASSALEAGAGLLLAASAAALATRRPGAASLLALGSAGEALWYGLPFAAAVLFPAAICAIATVRG